MKGLDKVLFLDIDGVLNSDRYHRSLTEERFLYGMELDSKAILLLKNFLDTHLDVNVVICSSWRDTLSLDQFNDLFKTYGIQDRVVSLTNADMGKGESIELWVKTFAPTSFVVIDDDQLFDLRHPFSAHQIKTSMGLGLQSHHIETLKKLFKN
jgi:hypothetical protein